MTSSTNWPVGSDFMCEGIIGSTFAGINIPPLDKCFNSSGRPSLAAAADFHDDEVA